MKKITLLLAFLCISLLANAQATCNQTFTATGQDDGPTVLIINAADLTCQGAGAITALQLVNSADTLTSGFCTTNGTSWYGFNLSIDGATPIPVCDGEINGTDISGFTTLTITSQDNDNFSDGIDITIDVEVTFTPTTPPLCDASLTSPVNGDTAATTDGILVWSAASGGATGYNLTVGTTPGGNDILASTALGNVTTYNLGALTATTSYYVTIEAFNGNGTATGCIEQTFTTYTPVPGDTCDIALPVSCGVTETGTTVGATSNGAPTGTCGTGAGAPGVWYSFTATGNDFVTASLCGSAFDTKIQVFEGSCGALTCVSGNDDECGVQSETIFNTVQGTEYYIYVFGFGSSTGIFQLDVTCVTPPPAPDNDECAFAVPVSTNTDSSCTNFVSGTIFGATASTDADDCNGDFESNPHDDVWFSFIATAQTHLISLPNAINQEDSTAYDNLYISVYEGTCGSLTNVSCTSGIEVPQTDLTIGTTYYIRVYSQEDDGLVNVTFDVCVGLGPDTTINGSCEDADAFCANAGSFEFANVSGNAFPDAPDEVVDNTCLGGAPNPAWFFVQVDTAGDMEFEIAQTTEPNGAGTGLDVDYALWGPFSNTGELCTAFTFGDCVGDHDCSGFAIDCSFSIDSVENATITNAQAGSFYLFLITNWDGDPGYITLTQTNAGDPGAGATDCTILCPDVTAIDASCGLDNGVIIIDSLEPNTDYIINYDFNGTAVTPINVTSNGVGDVVLNDLAPGDYTNIVTDAPECDSVDRDVTIIDATAPRIDSLVAANNSICGGVDVVFVITGTPHSTVTYTLDGTTDETVEIDASGVVAVVVTAPTENVTIALSLISQNGCDSDLTETATTTVVNLTADLGEDFAFCQSTPQDLTVITTDASTSAIYVWTLDGVVIAGASTDTITVSTTGTYQVTITDGMCSVNDSVSVSVTSVMTMDLGTDITACSNVPTILTADSNIGASGITYTWTLDGNVITGETSQTIEATTSGTYVVSGVSGGCNASATVNVAISSAFTLGLTDLQLCAGEPITLDASPIEAVTAPTYQWQLNGVDIVGGTTAIINPIEYGTYSVAVTSGACVINQTIEVTEATSLFTVVITGDTEICVNESTILTAEVTSGSNPTYVWSTGETTATINVEPAIFPATYSVTVTDDSGCSSIVDVIVNEVTGCVIPQGISPNNDGINDCFDMSSFEADKISIFNRYGSKVYDKNNYRNEWCGTTEDGNSGSELPTGTYYYVLELPTGEVMKNWVYINREK